MDETVLYNTFLHAPRMKQLVRSTFPDFHDDDIERNFEKIFFDIGTVGNATNEALVKKIHREYERYGVPPSKEKIAYLLDIYKGTSVQRKKEVLSAIGATLSLGYAIDNGIITDQYLE